MQAPNEALPALSVTASPPLVLGTADLTHFAFANHGLDELLARIVEAHPSQAATTSAASAARTYDIAIALQLAFRRDEGLDLLAEAVAQNPVFRLRHSGALRLLALVAPGDLMANTPLDFLTNHLDVQLDLLHVVPGQALPAVVPDHDVAFFAIGDADPATVGRLVHLYNHWPRPVLNNPAALPRLERQSLSQLLSGVSGICSPAAHRVSRSMLEKCVPANSAPAGSAYPCLIRPVASHAGMGLARLESANDLAAYLRDTSEDTFFVTDFHDYRGPDGLYRKLRVAFVEGVPFLCHMAISSHWMVHYLNAGMTESAAKRAEEAQAMAGFDAGFARRHAAAFQALHERLGFDYYSIDCAETRDGRLLVFEADTAAIVHLMDPPDLFPYKPAAMWRLFRAFEAMLHRRAARRMPLHRSRLPEIAEAAA